jgi:hypothetical protein
MPSNSEFTIAASVVASRRPICCLQANTSVGAARLQNVVEDVRSTPMPESIFSLVAIGQRRFSPATQREQQLLL